jgi:multidrug efflux pump subunit AcrA (membrane-fusion protein)
VSLIASSGSSTVASFPVTISVTGTPSGLYAGESVSVSIITKQLNNVVEVPTAAISYTSGNPTVTEVVGGKNVTQPVTTGIAASGETQITAGVNAGDVILERQVSFNANAARNATRNLFGGTGSTGANNPGGLPGGGAFFRGGGANFAGGGSG